MNLKPSFNLNKFIRFGARSLVNSKIIMLLVLIVSIIYMLGYDTAYVSSMKKISELTKVQDEKKKKVDEQKSEIERLKKWESELKGIETEIPELESDASARVAATTESKRITDLIAGVGRDTTEFPSLPAPHDKLQLLDFKLTNETTISIAEDATITVGDAKPQAGADPKKKEDTKPMSKPLVLSQFNYEMKIRGTYAALADFINQLVQSKKLVAIQKIQILKASSKEKTVDPDPETEPNHPVELDMTLLFSLYFYEPSKA
jgi:Tfp pilus assembly protein PilO